MTTKDQIALAKLYNESRIDTNPNDYTKPLNINGKRVDFWSNEDSLNAAVETSKDGRSVEISYKFDFEGNPIGVYVNGGSLSPSLLDLRDHIQNYAQHHKNEDGGVYDDFKTINQD